MGSQNPEPPRRYFICEGVLYLRECIIWEGIYFGEAYGAFIDNPSGDLGLGPPRRLLAGESLLTNPLSLALSIRSASGSMREGGPWAG